MLGEHGDPGQGTGRHASQDGERETDERTDVTSLQRDEDISI